MELTRKQAIELSIEVWTYLRGHQEIYLKANLPGYLLNKIKGLDCQCPLCELYYDTPIPCKGCPLDPRVSDMRYIPYCSRNDSPYSKWSNAAWNTMRGRVARKRAAGEIVRILEETLAKELANV